MTSIRIQTPIPGPRSQELTARRDAAVASGLARSTPVAVARAEGARVHDVDGNVLLDFAGGIGMLNAGHCPPGVVAAIESQARELVHVCALVATYEPYVELCEQLNRLVPGEFPKKTLLSNSGAEAVENAVKLARAFTGRPALVTFEGGFHGRTLLGMSLTSKYALFKKGFGPFAPEVYRLPVPDMYRRPAGMSEDEYLGFSVRHLEEAFVAQVDPGAVAAVIVEPVQGEAGFRPLPVPFLERIRELCDEHGMVMVADEVQSGFGRTGRMFAIEHYGIVPDVVTMAKSLGAGMPIAATTGRAEIMDAAHLGGIGGTYSGSPVACAAALASLRQIRDEDLVGRAERIGAIMQERMSAWKQELPLIGDVRGMGAMRLIELVRDRESKEPAQEEALQIVKEATARGLLMIRAGLFSNCVRLLPPLVITDEQLEEGLDVLRGAVGAVAGAPAGS